MKKDIEIYELIENYLKGGLSPDEKYAFEIRISSDPELADMVDKHRQLAEFIEEGTLLEIRDNIRLIHNQHPGGSGSGFSSGKVLLFISGILIVALTVSILFFRKPVKEDPSDSTVIPSVSEPVELQMESVRNIEETTRVKKIKIPKPLVEKLDRESETATNSNPVQSVDIADKDSQGKKDIKSPLEMEIPADSPAGMNASDNELMTDSEKSEKEPVSKGINCDTVQIIASVQTSESCEERATGKILVEIESAQGASPPYTVSIDKGKNYRSQTHLMNLYPGIYPVWLREKNNCISKIGNFLIESIVCDQEYIFAPDKGELWEVPVNERNGTLKIFTKQGKLVYIQTFDEGEIIFWDGISASGDPQPMGVYRFIIEFRNEESLVGNVTIVR